MGERWVIINPVPAEAEPRTGDKCGEKMKHTLKNTIPEIHKYTNKRTYGMAFSAVEQEKKVLILTRK